MIIRGRLNHENLLQYVDNFRVELSLNADTNVHRKILGQFFTPIEVAKQMLQPIGTLPDRVRVLDPGAGAGMLSAAVVARILSSNPTDVREMEFVAYEIDASVAPYLRKTFDMCTSLSMRYGINFKYTIHIVDFIAAATTDLYSADRFDLAILNPPYRKIKSGCKEWSLLRKHGLPHSNLYAAFMTLAAIFLKEGGRLVSITPRSFCNGPYFLPFRKALLSQMTISDVHLYDSRTKAFGADDVLQENIILCANKSRNPVEVKITASDGPLDKDVSVQLLQPDELVNRRDRNLVIHLIRNGYERWISRVVNALNGTLHDLNVSVSTGPVVAFRARELLRMPHEVGSVPLLLPSNVVNGYVEWPIPRSKKLSAIDLKCSKSTLLVPNVCYVLVKRFTAKEQKRRLSAAVLDPNRLNYDHIGIENHLNYFHRNGSGLPIDLAKGLAAYLNSSMVDQYFRLFSGHTQVNATDLRTIKYPDACVLIRMGRRIPDVFPSQEQLDQIVVEELGMQQEGKAWSIQAKIDESLEILSAVGVPRAQQNNRSALTLLSLVNIKPNDSWSDASAPLRRISEMMEFFSTNYGITYAPNTRETVRRQTIHQFWQMGIIVHNPDEPNRPVNSPHYCYQIATRFLELVRSFGDSSWDDKLTLFRIEAGEKLTVLSGRKRTLTRTPVTLPDGSTVRLTAGGQNELMKLIVEEFCPRFAKGGEILYLGDAGDKLTDIQVRRFQDLGIQLDRHGKTPDVIVYVQAENWLILIEAVTSHGPIDQKRQNELRELFSNSPAGLVFVTAFESRQAMTRFLSEISWETEVWIADAPDHLIHFDGERFLGPYR